jgi:trk system potassium uptake protein TrkH
MRSLLAVIHVLGSLLALFALYFLLPIFTALIYRETAVKEFLVAAGLTLAIGLALRLVTSRFRSELKPRDGYLLVTLSWLGVAAAATIPLLMQVDELSFTDAYFETMSGLTTTGATVLSGLDALPHAVNLWRHALHWLGGMGIIVLAVAILPLLGVGGMQMYRAETPGPVNDAKLTPRITQTAKLLWLVYGGITLASIVALRLAGMGWFDAICHSFSVMSLGGFSSHDANIGYFNSPLIEAVLIVFMMLASINFATHFVAIRRGDLGAYRRDPEARWTWLVMIVGMLTVSAFIWHSGTYSTAASALRNGAFAVASMASTTGFVSANIGHWPVFAPILMLFLSSVCCCTGSTGGGIKMFRALVLVKQSFREMFILVHPQAVAPLKIDAALVPDRVAWSVLAFIFLYFATIVVLIFALLASGLDFMSAAAAIIACVNNTGLGLGLVNASNNYAVLSDFQTWVCTLAMFMGRIEIFTLLVIFTPSFWRK